MTDRNGDAELRIGPVDLRDPAFIELVRRHIAHARATTQPENVFALDLDGLSGPAIRVYGLWRNGTLIGMGALSDLGDGEGEIKSMHVVEAQRGKGFARRILRHLVAEARARGMSGLKLETGSMDAYAPARQLYLAEGFEICGPFGSYPDHPTSAFLQKPLRE